MKAGLKMLGSCCRYVALKILRSFIDLVMRLFQRAGTVNQILQFTLSGMKRLKNFYQMEIN